MYLRRNRRSVGGESYEYWTLVKTVRTAKGPRQQVVATLGKEPQGDAKVRRGWEDVAALLDGTPARPVQGRRHAPSCGMAEAKDARFPTTHWTLVTRLRSADAEVARRALEDLIAQYRYPLYPYIRRRGLAHHDAEDALHDFLAKLLRLRMLEDADAARGRLRGYLCGALGRFLMNWQRDEARRAGAAGEFTAAGGDEARCAKERFTESDTPERVFERKWGHALMGRVMERLKAQCAEHGKGALFSALRPVLQAGGSLRGHDAAAIAAGLAMSEGALRAALNRHLRDCRAILEEEVRQTVEHPGDVADEIAHLPALFHQD